MRCPHCDHEISPRQRLSFRLDGGLHCPSCRRLYYAIWPTESRVVPGAAFRTFGIVLAGGAAGAGVVLALLYFTRPHDPWVGMVLATLFVLFAFVAMVVALLSGPRSSARQVSVVDVLPEYLRKRRKILATGSYFYVVVTFAFLTAFLFGNESIVLVLIQACSTFAFLLCTVVAYSWRPKRTQATPR